MLQKSKSKQLNLVKYALLIPMVFAMLIYTSTEVRAQKKDEVKHKLYQELTDAELIEKYYDEIVAMKKNGATFMELMEFAGFSEKNKEQYMLSRTEFLKMKAYMEYLADGILEKKLEEGSLTEKDIESSERLRLNKFKNYEEFKAFKNTKEEKERWESNTEGGVLKLFVNDVANRTEEETKRYNGLLKQLENDNYYNKLVVTDGKSTLVLDSYVSNDGEEIITEEVEVLEVPFSVVEETPTTVDCKDLESTKERKNCFNAFINKHIGKNFNTSIADSLSPGKKRVFVQFKVDKEGKVDHIVARGPSKALEEEAKRVVATLPQFVPGKQKGKPVVVPFSIPIVFEVKGDNNTNDNQSSDNGELIYISFNKVDSPAVFPDCNSISDATEQRSCTVNAINKFIVQKFNMSSPKFTNLSAGRKRIYAHFIIDKLGNVTNIEAKSAHPELDEEAKRVIALLPQFTPAKHKGEDVDVRYSLPIVLQFVGDKKD